MLVFVRGIANDESKDGDGSESKADKRQRLDVASSSSSSNASASADQDSKEGKRSSGKKGNRKPTKADAKAPAKRVVSHYSEPSSDELRDLLLNKKLVQKPENFDVIKERCMPKGGRVERDLRRARGCLDRALGDDGALYLRNPFQFQCVFCPEADAVYACERSCNLKDWKKHVSTVHKGIAGSVELVGVLQSALSARELSSVTRLQLNGAEFVPVGKTPVNLKKMWRWIDTSESISNSEPSSNLERENREAEAKDGCASPAGSDADVVEVA